MLFIMKVKTKPGKAILKTLQHSMQRPFYGATFTADSSANTALEGKVSMCVYKDDVGKIITLKPTKNQKSTISSDSNWTKGNNGNTYTCKVSETVCNFE